MNGSAHCGPCPPPSAGPSQWHRPCRGPLTGGQGLPGPFDISSHTSIRVQMTHISGTLNPEPLYKWTHLSVLYLDHYSGGLEHGLQISSFYLWRPISFHFTVWTGLLNIDVFARNCCLLTWNIILVSLVFKWKQCLYFRDLIQSQLNILVKL